MATKTITQRIAFEGGKEMEIQLKSLGDAGTTAFKRLQTAANDATVGAQILPIVAAIKKGLDDLADAADKLKKKFDDLESSVKTNIESIAKLGLAVGGAAAGFVYLVKGAADTAANLKDTAEGLGITVAQLQELQFAAAQFGVSSDQMVSSLAHLGQQVNQSIKAATQQRIAQTALNKELADGTITFKQYNDKQLVLNNSAANQNDIFKRLGVSIHDANGNLKNILDIQNDVADALHNTTNETARLAAGQQALGKGQVGMIALYSQGSEAIKAFNAESERVAPSLSKIQTQVAGEFVAAFNTLAKSIGSAKEAFLLMFAPEGTELARALTEVVVALRPTFIDLAATITTKLRPVIEDVISLLQGKDIAKDSFVAQFRDDMIAFGAAVNDVVFGVVVPAFKLFLATMNVVAEALNAIFGTHVSGLELAFAVALAGLIGVFGTLASAIGLVVTAVGVLAAAPAAFEIALIALGVFVGAWVGSSLVDPFNNAIDSIKGFFQSMADWVGDKLDGIFAFLLKIVAAAKSAMSAVAGLGGGSNDGTQGQAFASGGAVRGPGTSRSDSILAWLSNREFVHQAPAVAYYGENFMHAINQMRIPKSVLMGLQGFANGGAVRALSSLSPISRFADGGLASLSLAGASGSGRPFVLNIGGETFTGMSAEDSTFERLQRFAVRRNVQSSGRKPLWVR